MGRDRQVEAHQLEISQFEASRGKSRQASDETAGFFGHGCRHGRETGTPRDRVVHGPRFAVRGLRFEICGLRFTNCGLRFAICGLRSAVRGPRSAVVTSIDRTPRLNARDGIGHAVHSRGIDERRQATEQQR
ncbi:MAG: hypothetical protein Q6370_007500 [Candidatus Sigynarchaeota archaeon]